MATFLGEFRCKVDVKGRIILPMALKKQMPADAMDHFVIRKDIFENCLVLYAMEDWNRQLEKIRKNINPYRREQNMFQRTFFRGTAELTLDSSNRILVSKKLMDLIGAERDVVLLGLDGRIELWAADVYDTIEMPADKFAEMTEKYMGGSINESDK